jgi:hypothetical protein
MLTMQQQVSAEWSKIPAKRKRKCMKKLSIYAWMAAAWTIMALLVLPACAQINLSPIKNKPPVMTLSKARLGPKCESKSADFEAALLCWLDQNTNVAVEMWYGPVPNEVGWIQWPIDAKKELVADFKQMAEWYLDGMQPSKAPQLFPDVVPVSATADPTCGHGMTVQMGNKVYIAVVANSLAAELTERYPWSIAKFNQGETAILFTQGEMMDYEPASDCPNAPPGYYTPGTIDHSTPANPPFTALFFKNNHLIGANAAETIALLFQWEKQLKHAGGVAGHPELDGNIYNYFWGPNAPPIPVAEIIEGTTYTGPISLGFGHWTYSCSGTQAFMESVLRAVNIPLQPTWQSCGHSTPYFPTAGVAMTHGDDPYGREGWVTAYPGYPAPKPIEYLITISEFNALFPSGQSVADCNTHIERRPADIAIQYGSDLLMQAYCQDQASGATQANGQVFALMKTWYDLPTLQSKGLWTTLANKTAALNYCATQH